MVERVKLWSNGIEFHLKTGDVLDVIPRYYGGFYVSFNERRSFTVTDSKVRSFFEKVINDEDPKAISVLKRIIERYSDDRTLDKYLEMYVRRGFLLDSREMTRIIKKRATVKSRKAVGIRLKDGWIFAGRSTRKYWIAFYVSDDLNRVMGLEGTDIDVKPVLLKALEDGDGALKEFCELCYVSELYEMIRCAKKWGLEQFERLAGLIKLKHELAADLSP